jgi:DNA-binding IclR family transcriptional regulator
MADVVNKSCAAVFSLLASQPNNWFTNDDIAGLTDISPRTVARHTRELADRGIIEQEETSPAYRFRMAAIPADETYHQRLNRAVEIFNLKK